MKQNITPEQLRNPKTLSDWQERIKLWLEMMGAKKNETKHHSRTTK